MITGTDIHVKINTAAMEVIARIIFGKLFLMVKSLNFKLISGMVETIR
jgi:hypothetical protein